MGFYNVPFFFPQDTVLPFFAFKAVAEAIVWCWGGGGESEYLYAEFMIAC